MCMKPNSIRIPAIVLWLAMWAGCAINAQDVSSILSEADETILSVMNHGEDSTTVYLQQQIILLEERLAQYVDSLLDARRELDIAKQRQRELEEHVKNGDVNTLILLRTYLTRPYTEKRNNDAIKRLEMITTPSLESDKQEFRHLFDNYKTYYESVMAVLKDASEDRSLHSPFKGVEVAQSYIKRLKQTDYCRNVYHKSFFIPFLDEIIDTAIMRLNGNDPSRNKEITLTDLINPDKK